MEDEEVCLRACLFSFMKLKIKALKHNENDIMNWGPQMKDPDDLIFPLNRSKIGFHPRSALSLTT